MKRKVFIVSAAVLFTAGAGMHLSGYCPLHHHLKASMAHVSAKKAAKPVLLASR
jgi:hypothetical protein